MKLTHTRALRMTAVGSAAVIGLAMIGAPGAGATGGYQDGSRPATHKVVAAGLDNPRQLSFSRSGDLLDRRSRRGGRRSMHHQPGGW